MTEPAIEPVVDLDEPGVDDTGSRPATPPMVTGRLRRAGGATKVGRIGPPSGRVREIDTSGVRRGRDDLVVPTGTDTSPHQLLAPETGGSIAFGLFTGIGFGLACVVYSAIVLSAPGITMSQWFKVAAGSNSATGKTQFYALAILLLVVLGIAIIPASLLAFRAARSLAFLKALVVGAAVVLAAYVTWYLVDAGAAIAFGTTSEWRGNWLLALLLTLGGLVTLAASFAGGAYLRARREFQARGRTRRSRRL